MTEDQDGNPYRGRFAPSPTGPLHFGSLVAAVASFADAQAHDGVWLIRIEDIDRPREVPGAAQQQIETLEKLGMQSDEPIWKQCDRDDAYQIAMQRLLDNNLAFPCGCTRKDLGYDGVYPGTCANGIPAGKKARSVRAHVGNVTISYADRIQGEITINLERECGPFVIRRADNLFAYQLAVVIDDAEQGITHIVRGADLIDSTPRQIHLQNALGLPTPCYAHVPVVTDDKGRKLSKSHRDLPVDLSTPVATLSRAWSFLGQTPITANSIGDFWQQAAQRWSIQNVPAQQPHAVQIPGLQ